MSNSQTNIERGLFNVENLVFERTSQSDGGSYPLPKTSCDFKYGASGRTDLMLTPCISPNKNGAPQPIYYPYVELVREFYRMTESLDKKLKQDGALLKSHILQGETSVKGKSAMHRLIRFFSLYGHTERKIPGRTYLYSKKEMEFMYPLLQVALLHGNGWNDDCYWHDAHLKHFNGDLSWKKTTRGRHELMAFLSQPILGWGWSKYPFKDNKHGYVPYKTYFNAEAAMKKFGSMTFEMYRVDRYNWKDKRYEATSKAKKTVYNLDWKP